MSITINKNSNYSLNDKCIVDSTISYEQAIENNVLSDLLIPSYKIFKSEYDNLSNNIDNLSDLIFVKEDQLGNKGLSGKVDFLLNVGINSMEYASDLTENYVQAENKLKNFFAQGDETENYSKFLKRGSVFRVNCTTDILSDDQGLTGLFDKDDFIILKNQCILSDISFCDIAIIRDYRVETKDLHDWTDANFLHLSGGDYVQGVESFKCVSADEEYISFKKLYDVGEYYLSDLITLNKTFESLYNVINETISLAELNDSIEFTLADNLHDAYNVINLIGQQLLDTKYTPMTLETCDLGEGYEKLRFIIDNADIKINKSLYEDLKRIDKRFDSIEIAVSKLNNNLSAYVKKSGDTIDYINIKGDITSKYIETHNDSDVIAVHGGNDNHGKLSIDLEHGLSDVVINGKSLEDYIVKDFRKHLIEADNSFDFLQDDNIEFKYSSDSNQLTIKNTKTDKCLSVDCTDFIKDGFLQSVELNQDDPENPYLLFTWNTDSVVNNNPMKILVRQLMTIYKAGDGLDLNDKKEFSVNYEKVAKKDKLDKVENKVESLENNFSSISTTVNDLKEKSTKNLKFDAIIDHFDKNSSIKNVLQRALEIDDKGSVRNNSLFRVQINDEEPLSTEYTTNDTPPFTFTKTDFIIVHDSRSTIETIKLEDINHENTFVVKTGVSYKDLVEEQTIRSSETQALSTSLSSLSSELSQEINTRTSSDQTLTTAIKNKVYIENLIEGHEFFGNCDLSVIKLPKEKYDDLVSTNEICESAIYIVSSDFIDAYGQVLSNLTMGDGEVLSCKDIATTKTYVDSEISEVTNKVSEVEKKLTNLMNNMLNTLSTIYTSKDTLSGDNINALFKFMDGMYTYLSSVQ